MILDCVFISVIAFVYCEILTRDEMILNKPYNMSYSLPWFIHKPLITCVYCFAGQLFLWRYLFVYDFDLWNFVSYFSMTLIFVYVMVIFDENFNVNLD